MAGLAQSEGRMSRSLRDVASRQQREDIVQMVSILPAAASCFPLPASGIFTKYQKKLLYYLPAAEAFVDEQEWLCLDLESSILRLVGS